MGTGTSGSSRRSSTRRRAGSSSSRRRSSRPAGDRTRDLLLSLPGVEEGPCYGAPGYRVRGKLLARLREDGETLVVKCGDEALEAWMHADPESFFLTDHYRGYGAVLVRLHTVEAGALRDLLVQSWRRLAPKRLTREYDAASALTGRHR